MIEIDKLIEKCRKNGLKITPQRLAIFEALINNRNHPSAETLHKEISKKYTTITLTTVYKTLEMLTNLGEVASLDIDSERKHFDPHIEPHHHIICKECKQIIDVFKIDNDVKPPKDVLERFKVDGFHIDFYGTCIKCHSAA